jgi:accessory gene regulator B
MRKLVDRIVDWWIAKGIVSPQEKEIYAYGLNEGLVTVGNMITSIVISILFKLFWLNILYLICYIPLRSYAGGIHAKTHLRCYYSSILLNIVVLVLLKYLPINSILGLCIILIIAGLTIIFLSPVEDKNKPFDKKEYTVFKKRARLILLVEIIAFAVILYFGLYQIAYTIAISLAMLAIMLVLGKIKNRVVDNKVVGDNG